MRMRHHNSGRGHMPCRLTALFVATIMTAGTVPEQHLQQKSDAMSQIANPNLIARRNHICEFIYGCGAHDQFE